MRVLFEDNGRSLYKGLDAKCSPLSSLLLKSLCSDYIYFSCSGRNMKDEINAHLLCCSDDIVAFFDVPLDNSYIVKSYNDLVEFFQSDNRVTIIPIICIEYQILRLFYSYNLIKMQDDFSQQVFEAIVNEDWKSYFEDMKDKYTAGFRFKSLENVCKSLLNRSKFSCQMNKYSKEGKNNLFGRYYLSGCDVCDKDDCKISNRYVVEQKAEMAYTSTPCFVSSDEYLDMIYSCYGIECRQFSSFSEVFGKQQVFYDKIGKVIGVRILIR